ncbi:MAG: hypothetical protein K5650_04420 [Bacteroidales bacterium]|nr:hypothetical protein [Bacteroidales bacterium]
MKRRRLIIRVVAALLLAGVASSCSSHGVYMNKRRKSDCDCPTFSLAAPPPPAVEG